MMLSKWTTGSLMGAVTGRRDRIGPPAEVVSMTGSGEG